MINVAGKDLSPVVSLDPCAANDAVDMGASVMADSFFTAVNYAGGFAPNNNWLLGWTAADSYGLIDGSSNVGPASSIVEGGVTISFDTYEGVWYTVQSSIDAAFTNVVDEADVLGSGATIGYVDPAADSAKFLPRDLQISGS